MYIKKKISVNIINLKNTDIKKKIKGKNFFIGPWCNDNFKFNNKEFNNSLNLYSRENIQDYKKDISILKKNYATILKIISKILNSIHQKNYKTIFWETLISRWLFTWINQTYFRWEYVKKIKKKFTIKNFFTSKSNNKYFVPLDTLEAVKLYQNNKLWCQYTFEQIFDIFFSKKLNKKYQTFRHNNNNYQNIIYPKYSIKNISKIFLYKTEFNYLTRIKIANNFKSYLLNKKNIKQK
jgi:putative transferase (TIGR04331 family)